MNKDKQETECSKCNGFGSHPDPIQPDLVSDITCNKCKGTGKVKKEQNIACETCGKWCSYDELVFEDVIPFCSDECKRNY